MGRPKLIDKYRVEERVNRVDMQAQFQQYLEGRVMMVANFVKMRWGVKPAGLLDAVQVSTVQASWGSHHVVTILLPRDISNYYDVERGIVKYTNGVFPIPDFVNIRVYSASHAGHEVDVIAIEAKLVMVAIPS